MQVYFFWSAAVMSLVTFSVHTFVGERLVVRPLLACAELSKASKWINFFCWHVVTILLLAFGVAYSYSALNPDRLELAVFVTILAALSSILSATVAIKGGINPFRLPSTSLFGIIAVLGFAGLLIG